MVGVNLIPKGVQLAQTRRRHISRWAIAIAVAGGVLTVPLTLGWVRRAEAANLRAQADQLQARLARSRNDLETVTTELDRVLSQLERALALRSKRPWSPLLALIGGRMPKGCWLTSIGTDPATPSAGARRSGRPRVLTSADSRREKPSAPKSTILIEGPEKLRIAGFATDAAEPHEFVIGLKDTGVFANVVLEHLRREPALGGFYFRFELLCEW